MQMREKVGKSRNTVFFQWFVAPEGRKEGSLQRRVRSQLARWEMKKCTPLWREAHFEVKMHKTMVGPLLEVEMSKKCTPLWREAHFEVKMYKAPQPRTIFGSCDVEKVHAVVARFPSQNVQNTPRSDHFWILLEGEMSKKCTPLWREAHLQVKMFKTLGVRTTFGGSDVASRGRRKGLCTLSKVSKTWGFCSILTTTNTTPHYTPIHYATLHLQLQLHLHYILLHYTPLHNTALNYTQLPYTTLHYITLLHYTPLHYIKLHYTTFHYTSLNYTTTTLHNTTTTQLHNYTPLHSTTLNYTPLN